MKLVAEASLREKAESRIASGVVGEGVPATSEQLMHELLVHQAELEMQNEALRDAQLELMDREAAYRDLFENAPVGYVVLDATCTILSANPRARELLGLSVAGKRFSQYLMADAAIAFERFRREVLGSQDRYTAEFTIVDDRGRRREVRVDAMRTNADCTEWRAALTDVSVQNTALRKLNHSERLQAIGEHASGIAHDLNNLLYSIAGHTDVALRFLREDDAAYQPLVQLRSVVERCAAATEQLASFSRAETGEPAVVNLNDAVADMESIVGSLLGEDVDVSMDLAATDPIIRIDRSHVEQILLSAVRNAQHAMPHGGSFRVETANVVLPERGWSVDVGSARFVRWSISDTGIGMAESTRRRAFEPFFTTKPSGSGTGLGLALAKAIVERAGGAVLLESELGRGTSLVIHLPCASASGTMSSRPSPAPSEPAPISVMVVEHVPELRSRIAARLRHAGCDVVLPGSIEEALEQLRKIANRVAVLLVDEGLPGSVENEFLRAVRSVAPFVEVVVASFVNEGSGAEGASDDAAIEAVAERVLLAMSRLNQ